MFKRFLQMFGISAIDQKKKDPVIIVSGLPRSGTSMMMKILEAGGLPPLTDNLRVADLDNPEGYYEFERVKKLSEGDIAWLEDTQGKVVKILAILLFHLPNTYDYRIIFMRRAMPEILASQRKMLINRGEDPDKISNDEIARLYEKYFRQAYTWLNNQPNVEYLDINYNELVRNPRPQIEEVNKFLGDILDEEKMITVVDPSLYRQRNQASHS